jgi:transcriptional regulator with XRE-family HTH domain
MAQIAKNIKKQRVRRGMTQEELAEQLYVTRQTISNYENGKSNPDIETLQQMARILDTDMEFFVYGEQKPKDKKEIFKTATILGAILLVMLITPIIENYEKEWARTYYRLASYSYFMRIIGFPILLVIAGACTVKFIMLLTGGSPLRLPKRKTTHRVILFSFIGYVMLMLPHTVIYIILNNFSISYISYGVILNQIHFSIALFIYRFPIVYYAVFFIIGCLLHLTFSRKAAPVEVVS